MASLPCSSTSFLFHQQRSCLIPRSSYSTWFRNTSDNANALCSRSRSMTTPSRSRSDSVYHGAAVQSPVGFSNDDDDVFADEKQVKIPSSSSTSSLPPHWEFCDTMLQKVSINFALTIPLLNDTHLRHAVCIFYLVVRALDTVEDDTSIPTDIRVPILNSFHRRIYDPTWHFPCGTRQHDMVLMDEFRHLSYAFLELEKSYQEVIEDILKRMGAGMAKFICKEVETVDGYDEYCHFVTGLSMIGVSKLFHISCSEDCIPPDNLANSIGLFYQKAHIIKDYLDDINEIPKPRMFWPREIWSKYVGKLQDLKEEENSVKAVQCLNEMVTNALIHAEDSLLFLSSWKDPSMFRFHATLQITTMGNLALFYDNIEVFRRYSLAISPGLIDRISNETESMVDVYGAFFDFSCILKSKVNKNDPNATLTLSRLDAIQKACTDSGFLNTKRKLYVV